MLFSFRLPVVVSVGLLVPFVTLLYVIITCFFNTNKQAILARTKEEKIKDQIEVLDEKLTGAILRQKSLVR